MQSDLEALLKANDILRDSQPSGPEHRPRSIVDLDIRQTILDDIALKTLYLSGPFTVSQLAQLTCLSFEVATELFHRMRSETLCQVTGMVGNVPNIAITSLGRVRALELLAQNQYTGSAPVSLQKYVEQVRKQSVRNVQVFPEHVERAFSHLVLDPQLLRQFGTALNSGSAIFLYGPPGAGKTAVAETMSRVLAQDAVWIPHAVEIDGQIITVYDPIIHRRCAELEPAMRDERWVLCHRPSVLVGGELTMEMLDLQINAFTKFYVAPVQMKANNGVLIIDDFGRQRIRPDELLNRWVVPLDRGMDFMTLAGGRKIEMPFELLIVFASNIDPAQLGDAAFLRRIQTKIKIGEVSDSQFHEIFRRVAAENGMEADPTMIHELIVVIRGSLQQELRACYPRDLINQICWAARYERITPLLDRPSLMRAVEAYFLPGN